MAKLLLSEDDSVNITTNFFEIGAESGQYWCKICQANGNHKSKLFEAPKGRTNLMNHLKTHKNYESEWAIDKALRLTEPSSRAKTSFVVLLPF